MTVRHDVSQIREVEEALRRSEAKYRGIFEKIQDIFFQTNDQGLIVEASPSVERYGYTREEMIGMPAARVYEDPSKRITLLQLLEDGDITDREVRLRARDGRVVDFSISAHMLRGPDGAPAGMEGCLRDISDRKRAEEALRRSERELAIRNKIADIFLTVPDEEMYGEALQVVLEALESRHGVFGYIDENGAIVRASMTRDVWDQCRVSDKDIVCPPEQWGGIWGRALTEKKSLYSNEPGRVPEGHIPILNSLAVPIIHRKRVIGLLHVANKETGYDDNDQRLLETVAGHIAPILRARLQRDRQERRRRLAEEELKGHRDRLEELVEGRTAELTQANESLLREIEERRQAEEALRESEEKYRQLVENLQEGVWALDKDGHTTFANPRMAEMLGYTVDEMLGKHLLSFMDEQWQEVAKEKLERRRQGVVEQHDFEFLRKDGTRVYTSLATNPVTDRDGNYIGALAGIMDITDRLQAEEALRESEERFRTLSASAPVGIFLMEKKGQITYTNERLQAIAGVPPGGGPMEQLATAVHPDDRERVLAEWAKAAKERAELSQEFRILTPQRETRWVRMHVCPIFSADGSRSSVVGTVEDITERRQVEEQARQLHAEHVRANELRRMVRILEQMAATLAHELRNPLGVISNSVYFLANQARIDGPKAQQHVLIIGREVASARRVIDDILEFAHVPQLLPAVASINAVVDSALARSQVPANIRVVRRLAVDLPPVVCDEERLERAFIDVIANAVQAMPHGGRLGVKTCQSGDEIKVAFSDSGVGIAPENIDKVFDPMFTTKLRGIGLGLTVVRRTVEQHGGRISVRSHLGQGTVFTIVLPRDCRPFAAKGGRVA